VRKEFDVLAGVYERLRAPLAYKLFAGPFGKYDTAIKSVISALQGKRSDILLDVTTGTGLVFKEFLRVVDGEASIVGIDLSLGMLEQAKKYVKKKQMQDIHLIMADAENLPLLPMTFSKVACSGAFPGFPNPERALKEMSKVIKPGGRISILFLDEPTGYLMQRMLKHIEESHHVPVQLFRPDRIRSLLLDMGFRGVEITKLSGIWRVVTAQK